MGTRVYQFGLRPPVENERLVREQLRAAHEYRNDLVAIERGRRAALRAIDLACSEVVEAETAVRAATRSARSAAIVGLRAARKRARAAATDDLARIAELDESLRRDARALTACYWGTYLGIEAAHQQSRAQPLYGDDAVSPNDPVFVRGPRWQEAFDPDDPRSVWWLAQGQIGVQLQGGLATSDALAGKDTRVQLSITGEGKRGRKYGILRVRVGSDGRDPIWAAWPIKMHRAVPSTATWKWVRVSLRVEGMREVWTVEITVEDSAPRPRDLALPFSGATIAVEWDWTPAEDGSLRVGRWADDRGLGGEIILPASVVSGIRKPDGIGSVRDKLTNEMRKQLLHAIESAPEAPAFVREAATTMCLWNKPRRFRALAMRWRREGLPDPREAYDLLDAWERRDDHLLAYEAGARSEALRERREIYRVLAATWSRKYRTCLLSDQDLSREARWGDRSDARFTAGVSELRTALRQAFGEDAVDARWRDEPAEGDERSWCERCRDAWVSGGERGDGRFAGKKEKTANAWRLRKEKAAHKKSSATL